MRRISIAILVLSILTSVVGCAKQEQDAAMPTQTEMVETLDSQETVVEETVNKREVVAARTDYLTEADMQSASPWKVCDNSAIAAVMKKAEAGESITIATIGGSITQGTISNGTLDREVKEKKCYADIFFSWWKETFPEVEVKVVNAGIGATDSYLGVHRVQKDVLDYQPDLVLVEYSVNDDASNTYKKSYDNLVRKILKSENTPAVLLLFMGQTNLSSAQSVHQLVGFNYGLPMVSYLNLISDFMDSGRYTAKDLAGDVTHPSALGHAITGEMLWKYLNHIYANIDSYEEPVPFEQKGITKDTYLSAEMLGVGEILPDVMGTFAENKNFNGWGDAWTTTEGDGEITFTITCRNLGILFWRSTTGTYGMYEVWIDGELKANLQADFTGGWGSYAYSQEVFTSEEDKEHVITIKKASNSDADDFTLLRFLISH